MCQMCVLTLFRYSQLLTDTHSLGVHVLTAIQNLHHSDMSTKYSATRSVEETHRLYTT